MKSQLEPNFSYHKSTVIVEIREKFLKEKRTDTKQTNQLFLTQFQNSFTNFSNHPSPTLCAMAPPKYVKINGIMKKNPEYEAWQRRQGATSSVGVIPNTDKQLAVVSNMDDYETFNKAVVVYGEKNERPMAESTSATIEMMQDPDMAERVGLKSDEWLDRLGEIFARYEVPIGLMNKLMELQEFDMLEFLMDDSGSMTLNSDTHWPDGRFMTRWQEAQERLKTIMSILAHVPTNKIKICFLNRGEVLVYDRTKAMTPEAFMQQTHAEIDRIFARGPSGGTPFYRKIKMSLDQPGRIARYFFGDGLPTDSHSAIEDIKRLVVNRRDPKGNPITFMSCSNEDGDVEWMKELEEAALYVSEFDDYKDELTEVQKDQGTAFPFTEGMYLVGMLVAAMNPEDLDAIDESVPFTKAMLDNIMGVQTSMEDFMYYFNGFQSAQRARVPASAADRVKIKTQWRAEDFMTFPQRSAIPAVQEYHQRLHHAVHGMTRHYAGPSVQSYGYSGHQGQQPYGNSGFQGQQPYSNSGYQGQPQYGNSGYQAQQQYGNTGYPGPHYSSTGYQGQQAGYGTGHSSNGNALSRGLSSFFKRL